MKVVRNASQWLVSASTIGLMFASSVAAAQDGTSNAQAAESPTISEIVVTAEKRQSTVQSTPIAITALSGDDIAKQGITDVSRLAEFVPGLNVAAHGFGGSQSVMAIRGVGSSNLIGDPTVAFHVDGQYFASPRSLNGIFYDLERLEVLKGPQGTLYGRNSTAGVINVITAKPKDMFDANLTGTVGNYDRRGLQGMVNVPLVSSLLDARVAFNFDKHDGYQKGITPGQQDIYDANDLAIRGSLLFTPADNFSAQFTGDFYRGRNNGAGYQQLNNPYIPAASLDPFKNYFNTDMFNHQKSMSYRLAAQWDLGAVVINSLTAYKIDTLHSLVDQDGNSVQISTAERKNRQTAFQQELRISSADKGFFEWQVGAFYYKEKISEKFFVNTDLAPNPEFGYVQLAPGVTLLDVATPAGQLDPGFGLTLDPNLRTSESFALFTHNKLNLSDTFTATIGARYTHDTNGRERTEVPNPAVVKSAKFDSFTWKAGIDWHPGRWFLAYASVGTGFKAGGTNEGATAPAFDPEKILAFEAGVKTTFLDGRARVNLAGFYYDYKDLQVAVVINNESYTQNASKATVWGGEIEAIFKPVDNLTLNFSASYVNSKLGNLQVACPLAISVTSSVCPGIAGFYPASGPTIDVSGNPLAQAPELSLTAAAQYAVQIGNGELTAGVNYSYQSSILTQTYATSAPFAALRQKGSGSLDANLRYEIDGGRWFVEGFANNITNTTRLVAGFVIPPSSIFGSYAPPRTFGARIGWKFR